LSEEKAGWSGWWFDGERIDVEFSSFLLLANKRERASYRSGLLQAGVF